MITGRSPTISCDPVVEVSGVLLSVRMTAVGIGEVSNASLFFLTQYALFLEHFILPECRTCI